MHRRLDGVDVDLIDFVGWEEGEGVGDVDVEDDLTGVWGRLNDIDDYEPALHVRVLNTVVLRKVKTPRSTIIIKSKRPVRLQIDAQIQELCSIFVNVIVRSHPQFSLHTFRMSSNEFLHPALAR